MKNTIPLVMLLIFVLGCNNKNQVDKNMVIVPGKPLQGTIKLKTKKVMTIDSLTIDNVNPPVFGFLSRDKNGDIYIGSNRPDIRIYKFSGSGVFLKQFLGRGEGPGELKSIYRLQYVDDTVFVSSDRKTIEFDTEGNYVSERKFKKSYQGIVYSDKDHFIANYYKIDKKNKNIIRRLCSIINKREEEKVVKLFDSDRENIGRIYVKDNEGKTVVTLSLAGITPDFLSLYNHHNRLIYQCLSSESQIFIKDIKGNLRKRIKRDFKNRVLTADDRNDLMKNFRGFPGDFKMAVKKNLPKEMVAISSIKLLPKGYFAVYFYKSFDEHEVCIFYEDGEFRYIIEFPEEDINRHPIFTEKGFAAIERREDRDLYVEYEITNLPEIFSISGAKK